MTYHIETFLVSPYQQNARIIIDLEKRRALMIDPGDDVQRLMAFIEKQEVLIESILLTHCHIDHAGGVASVYEYVHQKGIQRPALYFHQNEQALADNIEPYAEISGLSSKQFRNVPKPDAYLDMKRPFVFAGQPLVLRFVPGHSPGHVVLFFNEGAFSFSGAYSMPDFQGPLLIAGDTLFRGSIGRSDLPGGNGELLLSSIKSQLFSLPDKTVVLSGHGPNTSIGFEKLNNPFF